VIAVLVAVKPLASGRVERAAPRAKSSISSSLRAH